MRYFPFAIEDWETGVAGLSFAERGAYITILCEIYRTEGPAKLSSVELARRLNCSQPTAWRLIQALVKAGKLKIGADGSLMNGRARRELNQWKAKGAIKGVGRPRVSRVNKTNSPVNRTKDVPRWHKWEKLPAEQNRDIKKEDYKEKEQKKEGRKRTVNDALNDMRAGREAWEKSQRGNGHV